MRMDRGRGTSGRFYSSEASAILMRNAPARAENRRPHVLRLLWIPRIPGRRRTRARGLPKQLPARPRPELLGVEVGADAPGRARAAARWVADPAPEGGRRGAAGQHVEADRDLDRAFGLPAPGYGAEH